MMKHVLSGAMAAGWFCLAMAVFAQSMSVSLEPGASAPATVADPSRSAPTEESGEGGGRCLKQAVDQKVAGSSRAQLAKSCVMQQ